MFKLRLQSFSDYFQVQFNLLALTGLRFDFSNLKVKNCWSKAYKLLLTYVIFICTWNVSSVVLSLFLLNQKIDQKISFITLIFSTLENTSKTFCLFYNSKRISKILEDLKQDFKPKCQYLKKEAKIILTFAKVSTTIPRLFGLIPLFITIFVFVIAGKWSPLLINEQWYPFDPKDIRLYFFVFVSQYSMGVFVTNFLLGTDSTIMMIFAHINQQLIYLAEEFSFARTLESNRIKLVLERHCRIIE